MIAIKNIGHRHNCNYEHGMWSGEYKVSMILPWSDVAILHKYKNAIYTEDVLKYPQNRPIHNWDISNDKYELTYMALSTKTFFG